MCSKTIGWNLSIWVFTAVQSSFYRWFYWVPTTPNYRQLNQLLPRRKCDIPPIYIVRHSVDVQWKYVMKYIMSNSQMSAHESLDNRNYKYYNKFLIIMTWLSFLNSTTCFMTYSRTSLADRLLAGSLLLMPRMSPHSRTKYSRSSSVPTIQKLHG